MLSQVTKCFTLGCNNRCMCAHNIVCLYCSYLISICTILSKSTFTHAFNNDKQQMLCVNNHTDSACFLLGLDRMGMVAI